VDVERTHRRPDREQLERPANALQEDGDRRGNRLAHDAEAITRHHYEPPYLAGSVEHRAVMTSCARQREREKPEADRREDHEARQRPVRDLRGEEHVGDQEQHGEQVEHAVGEDRADQRRPRIRASLLLLMPREDRDARELANPPRQNCVREEAHAKGREDQAEGRPRRRHRLLDDAVPRGGARDDRQQIERDRRHDPLPVDEPECIGDEVPLRTTPDQEHNGRREGRKQEPEPAPRCLQQLHAATARRDAARDS
jgi:hypothetical protein